MRRTLTWIGTALLVTALGAGQAAAQRGQPVDLELVLAVDASSSVSPGEFNLQMQGLAAAFRNPSVQAAVEAVGDLGIAVAMVQWSDNRKQTTAIDWRRIRDPASAEAFAEEIDRTPRYLIGGGTAIGGALAFAMGQFDGNGFVGRRKVIDISGDGRTNQGSQPSDMRDRAIQRGITINGLAILNEDPTVDSYYFAHVIGGTGAFVLTANDYEAYRKAILAKLIREIAGVPVASRPRPRGPRLAAAAEQGELEYRP